MTNLGVTNLKNLKENNLSNVLRCIHANEHSSRVSLARATGLTQATITKIVNQLIAWGIVSEQEAITSSTMGRPPVRLTLNRGKYLVYSARINRDYLQVEIYDIVGVRLASRIKPIKPGESAETVIDQMQAFMEELAREAPAVPMALGIALPGPLNIGESRIALMSNFPGWERINLTTEFHKRMSLPVFLDHDANCCALAEQWYGIYRDCRNIMYVLADRGVGAGLILDGKIFHGAQGFAGEIGHISINMYGPRCECGNRGCLELYCSTIALENEYKRELAEISDPAEDFYLPAAEILSRVRQGDDPTAVKVYKRIINNLAFGVTSIVNTINPELIVFADKIIDGGDCFLPLMRQALKRHLLADVYDRLIISTSTVTGDPVTVGASVLAFEHILQNPSVFFSD